MPLDALARVIWRPRPGPDFFASDAWGRRDRHLGGPTGISLALFGADRAVFVVGAGIGLITAFIAMLMWSRVDDAA